MDNGNDLVQVLAGNKPVILEANIDIRSVALLSAGLFLAMALALIIVKKIG